ncbi:MAG TPA: DUF2079 domain-containing protein [Candidatus Cybelea sp.]|jgi:uncharacterized membrane protein
MRLPARLWFWAGVEFAVLVVLACIRAKLWTYGSDTGTFAQVVADAFGGMRNGVEDGSHFRYHWSPSLALLWPLVAWSGSALPLQILQAAATAVCAPLLATLARPYAGEKLAYRLGILTLLYPPLLALGFDEFHELGLFSALVLSMFVAADRARWLWFAVCAAVTLGLREDAVLTLFFFGIALLLAAARPAPEGAGLLDGRPRTTAATRRAGALLSIASVGVLLLYYLWIVPRFGGWRPNHFYVYPFARGPLALALAPFTHPLAFARAIFTFGRLTYVLEAFVPLLFLPLRSRWALLALPGGAVVLLANSGYVWRMGDHYAALWTPWLLVATVMGAVAVERKANLRVAINWTSAAAVVCVVFLIAFNPLHPLHYLHPYYHDLADARRALRCVPEDASLATYDEWFSAVAAKRPRATIDKLNGVEYLVYADDFPGDTFARSMRPAIEREVAHGQYRVVCRFGEVAAYRLEGLK